MLWDGQRKDEWTSSSASGGETAAPSSTQSVNRQLFKDGLFHLSQMFGFSFVSNSTEESEKHDGLMFFPLDDSAATRGDFAQYGLFD